ncbi:hypothetical protein BVY02_00175 [bacterium J17]|nr:hypothetical protein BVY02_00175 [bacterium J17]
MAVSLKDVNYSWLQRTKTPATTLLCLVALIGLLASPATAQQQVVPGQFIIKFKKLSAESDKQTAHAALGVALLKNSELTDTQLVESYDRNSFDEKFAKDLLAAGIVEFIEPNYIVSIDATPNDARYQELWGLHNDAQTGGTTDTDIDASEAWDLSTGSSDVVVGVVDTGINYNHPDLAANIWRNPNEIPNNGIDDDLNGVIDDVYGFNSLANNGDPNDDHGHGSHCAGTIGAVGNNNIGVSGINWNVKIMGLKFLDANGSGSVQDAIDVLEYAVRMKNSGVNLRVLNNSWGGTGFSQALNTAIEATRDAGILFAAAAGNEGNDNDSNPTYPASYDLDNIISVAAIDHDGNLASFSNYGANSVHIAAPGVNILSTITNEDYASWSGTSMATPHVSGVAALILAREPTLSTSELKNRIHSTVERPGTLTGLVSTAGLLNAVNALTNSLAPELPNVTSISYSKNPIEFTYSNELGTKIYSQDDGYAEVSLGFSFPFYGKEFSRVAVSANGRIIPLDSDEALPTESDFSNRLQSGISPLHDDLHPAPAATADGQGGVWAKVEQDSLRITWIVVPYSYRSDTDSQRTIRFQARLSSNGVIEFHYLDTEVGDSNFDYGASASVGVVPPRAVIGDSLSITNNQSNQNELGSNKALRLTRARNSAKSDIDGDGKSDLIVFRPSSGMWFLLLSSKNFSQDSYESYQLGLPGDTPLVGDFDGDHKADLAVWREETGMWYFRTSGSSYQVISSLQWGSPGDTPLVADYDGDGTSDLAVYRVSPGIFYSLLSSGGFNRAGAFSGSSSAMISTQVGGPANDPVVGDFTGDGKDDFMAIWQLIRFWQLKDSNGNFISAEPWGKPGDTPLGCDWDGDKRSERVVARVSERGVIDWFSASGTGAVYTDTFGSLGDSLHCNRDYDGDEKGDLRAFRPTTGEWFIKQSSDESVKTYQFGLPGDIAL